MYFQIIKIRVAVSIFKWCRPMQKYTNTYKVCKHENYITNTLSKVIVQQFSDANTVTNALLSTVQFAERGLMIAVLQNGDN